MGNLGRFPQGKTAATEPRCPTLIINYKVHAGSFRVSIIHRTLTWSTGSLTCVRDHSYACVYFTLLYFFTRLERGCLYKGRGICRIFGASMYYKSTPNMYGEEEKKNRNDLRHYPQRVLLGNLICFVFKSQIILIRNIGGYTDGAGRYGTDSTVPCQSLLTGCTLT